MYNPILSKGRVFALDFDRVTITDSYKINRFALIGISAFILSVGFYIITYPPSFIEYCISAVLLLTSIVSIIINFFYRTHQREILFEDVESVSLKDGSNSLYFVLKEGSYRPVKDLPGSIYNELTYFLRCQGLEVNYTGSKPHKAVAKKAISEWELN